MITPDDDRSLQLTRSNHLVEAQPKTVPFAVTEPADARWQALESDAFASQLDPTVETLVVRELFKHRLVSGRDIGWVPRQRNPAERSEALAEQRANVGREKAGVVERPLEPTQFGLGPQAVAVVEHLGPGVHEPHHCLAMCGHCRTRSTRELGRVGAL